MYTKKKLISIAKKLAEYSFGASGELSRERIDQVEQSIQELPERNRAFLLRKYLYFLEVVLKRHEVCIAFSGNCDVKGIHEEAEKKMGYPLSVKAIEDPQLIAGVCVTIGDHTWERSVRSDLEALC